MPDWVRMNVASAARDALTLIGEELASEQYKTDMLAYTALDGGRLTAEQALAFWYKKQALYTLQRRLMQKALQGVSAAKRIGETDG